jgi:hypothetical protein
MTKYITPVAVALGVAGGVIGVIDLASKPAKQPAPVAVQAPREPGILRHISAECQALINELSPGLVDRDPGCAPVETYLDSDSKPRRLWACDGATLPMPVQHCLGEP